MLGSNRREFVAARFVSLSFKFGRDFASGFGNAIFLEIVLTAILMWGILGVSTGAKEKGIAAGIVIGGVIALEALLEYSLVSECVRKNAAADAASVLKRLPPKKLKFKILLSWF